MRRFKAAPFFVESRDRTDGFEPEIKLECRSRVDLVIPTPKPRESELTYYRNRCLITSLAQEYQVIDNEAHHGKA
jgi:hypothetical protein